MEHRNSAGPIQAWIGTYRSGDDLFMSLYTFDGGRWVTVSTRRGTEEQELLRALYAAPESRTALADVLPQLAVPRAAILYPVAVKTVQGTLWGYIDDKGKVVLKPQYENAFDFQNNGLAVVQLHGKQGLIDATGEFVVQPIYGSIYDFSEGRAAVIDEQGFKVMDDLGRILTPRAYDFIGTYKDGRAMFSEMDAGGQTRYGYLDLQGREAIPARYEEAGDFADGKALVKVKEGEFALISPSGKTLAAYPYANVRSRGEGMLAFQKDITGKFGYIDEKGNVVVPPRFTDAFPFRDGRAVVNTAEDFGNQYGLIDKKGTFVLQPKYNNILPLGEKRIAVGKAIDPEQPFVGSVYALADTDGRFLTDYGFYSVAEFTGGKASATGRKETFWIDRNGRIVQNLPRVEGIGTMSFKGRLIKADIDQRVLYYDRKGKSVWKPPTVIPLQPPYRIQEIKYNPNRDYLVYYPQLEGMTDPAAQGKVNDILKTRSAVKPVPPDAQLSSNYTGDFSVTFYQQDLLVLELFGYDFPFGAAHGMPSRDFVHLNLVTGETYTLGDLFKPGAPYTERLTEIVKKQIETDPQYSYVFPDSTVEVTPDQLFYVDGEALYILFKPYEIAPYVAGFPTFRIPYPELMDIIATNGSFWKSYH